jgi:threonine aldolase
MATHEDEHTVKPAAVFVTQATEVGTVYRLAELAAVVQRAKEHHLRVFVDGARLAMAVASDSCDMSLADLSRLGVDVFTIGGTKVGAMAGEAIVIGDAALGTNFRYQLKQRGALLAKGRFLGLQFARFFDDDDLWLRLGRQSNTQARLLADGFKKLGIAMAYPDETNQVFAVLPEGVATHLAGLYGFYNWRAWDPTNRVVRFVCSWATPDTAIGELLRDVEALV